MKVSGDPITIASEICTFLEFIQTNLELDIPTMLIEMEETSVENSKELLNLVAALTLLMTKDPKDD